ncbi:E3 ubiquitin-protein ligase sina [Folsomia candida]|uniref:E3 ubiquitin-protein ligase sina n=1 Tax=Folsomia candida TaxID=158441 RepID=UPI001604C616|nr:E3 ubiquitin-protein ligase sina [Folsomia candida]
MENSRNEGRFDLKDNEKSDAPSTPALSEALECTICLDSAASPINECENGHVVCGICAEKITNCGLCKTNLQVSVLAERLSRQFNLKCSCPNGCVAKIAGADVKNHMEICEYRDVICQEQWGNECDQYQIPFQKFAMHLQVWHEIAFDEVDDGSYVTQNPSFTLAGDNFARPGDTGIFRVLTKHGKFFFFHFHTGIHFESIWVTVLGNRDEAEKHYFHLKISHDSDSKTKMEQSYTMPVLAYHDHSKFNPETMKGKCVSIPACVMTQFGVNKDLRDANKFYLNFTYTIV